MYPLVISRRLDRMLVAFAVGHTAAIGIDAAGCEAVTIDTDFPGGNVVVLQNDDTAVRVAPDLRGENPWF